MQCSSTPSAKASRAWSAAELKAEVLGTFTLLLGGCSVVASAQRRDVDAGVAGDHHAMALYENFGWAASIVVAILVSFDASGAHLNPAVTFAAMLHDGFDFTKGLLFMAMQFLGAFLAAALACMMFTGFNGQDKYVQNFYHTGPSPGTNMWNAGLVEAVATAMLMIGIKFVATGGPPQPNKVVMAFSVGAIVFFIGMNLGYMTGYSLNPARELSPRLVRFIDAVWRGQGAKGTFDNLDFLAPTLGPMLGAPLGVSIYKFCRSPEVEDKLDEQNLADSGAADMC